MNTIGKPLHCFWRVAASAMLAWLVSGNAQAVPISIGFLSFDQTTATTAQFDIVNLTGANVAAPDFPVVTAVTLSNLNLLVGFLGGSTQTFTQSDFTLSLDGLSYDGPVVATAGLVVPISALLNGDLSPTSLNNGSPVTVQSSFLPASLTNPTGGALVDGNLALIQASPAGGGGGGGGTVPEPGTLLLLAGAFIGWIPARLRARRASGQSAGLGWRKSMGVPLLACAAIGAPGLSLAAFAVTTVKLTAATSPSTGVAGVSSVKLTSTGLPAVAPGSVVIAIAPTCAVGGAVSGEVDTVAATITTVVGSTAQIKFNLPATLAQGTYFVSISGTDSGGTRFASNTCSIVSVTTSNTTLNSCLPSSSLSVALGTKVTAYVPNGWWGGSSTGVQAVPIEGGGAAASIPTADVVNSCASNPATGETVCTANTNAVYRITGTTVTNTLTSGATSGASFSGGTCRNCGVAINALTNTAYITVGIASSPSRSGIQGLNLNTGAFSALFPLSHIVSENISVDAGRNLLLSPGEDNSYGLIQLSPTGALVKEFANFSIGGGGEYDSAAEDCTTGIALAANEFTSNVSMADLNQATFTPGVGSSPGTWSSPNSVYSFAGSFSAGVSGISVAPGSSHLGVATGEFGGQSFAAFQLPSAPATGGTVPTIVDYAYVATVPNTPDGNGFSAGLDPHTITAYTSPNNGKPYALIADWALGTPSYVAVIDLQMIMAAPRNPGTHTVNQSVFNLLTSGAVRYVATH